MCIHAYSMHVQARASNTGGVNAGEAYGCSMVVPSVFHACNSGWTILLCSYSQHQISPAKSGWSNFKFVLVAARPPKKLTATVLGLQLYASAPLKLSKSRGRRRAEAFKGRCPSPYHLWPGLNCSGTLCWLDGSAFPISQPCWAPDSAGRCGLRPSACLCCLRDQAHINQVLDSQTSQALCLAPALTPCPFLMGPPSLCSSR